jgi:hypothetical protein
MQFPQFEFLAAARNGLFPHFGTPRNGIFCQDQSDRLGFAPAAVRDDEDAGIAKLLHGGRDDNVLLVGGVVGGLAVGLWLAGGVGGGAGGGSDGAASSVDGLIGTEFVGISIWLQNITEHINNQSVISH